MKKKNLIIIGSGGHSRVAIDIALELNHSILGIIDINFKQKIKEKILGIGVLGNMNILNNSPYNNSNIFLTIGDIKLRKKYYIRINKKFNVINLIHKSAIVSKHAKLGKGILINAGVIINADVKIGSNSIINTGAIIDHEVKIGSNVNICPRVSIGGRSIVENDSYIGIGSTIINSIRIGKNVTIGAGSVVINDIQDKLTCMGVPAKSKI